MFDFFVWFFLAVKFDYKLFQSFKAWDISLYILLMKRNTVREEQINSNIFYIHIFIVLSGRFQL